jgi:hypothetical protein
MTTKIPVELSSTPGIVDGSNATAITIDSSENVGIGTTSPNAVLTTDPESGNFSSTYNNYDGVGLFIRGNGTSGNGNYGPALVFGSCDSDTANQDHKHSAISVVQTNTDPNQTGLAFWTHPSATSTDALSESMRIDAAGNVGIGINAENAYTSYTALEISRSGSIYANNSADDINIGTNFYLESGGNWRAKNTETASLMQFDNGAVNIYTAASTTADNNISWNHKISFPNLGGIAFNGDTAQANALDDYEEGTWTIAVSSSDPGSMTATVSNGYGWYVKVGKVVHAGGSFDLSVSNGQGTMRITGLPYSCSSNGVRPLFVGQVGYTINVVPQPGYVTLGNGSSESYLDVWREGNNTRYDIVDWDSGGRMNFQITYEAA